MNKQIFFLWVISISMFGQNLCSSHEKPASEGPVSEKMLSLFKQNTIKPLKDCETGTYMHSQMIVQVPAASQVSAERLKTLVRYGENEVHVPAYNGTDCALILQVICVAGSSLTYKVRKGCTEFVTLSHHTRRLVVDDTLLEDAISTYQLRKGCGELIALSDDMQRVVIEDAMIRAEEIAPVWAPIRTHHSMYLAEDMFPISEALMFFVNKDKIALSVGGNIVVPVEIQDTVHYSTAE